MGTADVTQRPPVVRRVLVRALNDDAATWDAFVTGSPDASFCHLSGWREIVTDVMGHDCQYLAAVNHDGIWQGVLPLVRVTSRLFGDYVVSMPFLNCGGPVGDPAVRAALERLARAEARWLGVGLLELRNRGHESQELEISRRKITVLLDLPSSPDALWRSFASKLRSQVRHAEKSQLVTRFGPDQLDAFYSVFARNMRDLGTPVLSRAWFERIAKVFPSLVEFGAVYQGDTPVAAGCGFRWRNEFEMTWASSLRESNRLAGNMLLYWSFIRRMIDAGATVFNFGRCTPGGGTHRFKRQWGGTDVTLPWGVWSLGAVHATPNPDGGKYRLATAAWRQLPLPVANRFGPILARAIP